MAMIATRNNRAREIPGPAPNSYAIVERPRNRTGPEQKLIEWRKKAAEKLDYDQIVNQNDKKDIRNEWERHSNNKVQMAAVERRVRELKQTHEWQLNERRERLKHLLQMEEQQYLHEMEASQETLLERQAKMRSKARKLKEDRESERLNFVEKKLDEQWRDQCHELRATLSRRTQDLVAVERLEQMRIKDDIERSKQEEEKMYAELWYADMQAKADREEADALKQKLANKGVLETLQQQMAALEAKKLEEKRLVAEEAELMKEETRLRKIEELQALEEKRRRQEGTRRLLDKSLLLKRQKEAREMQEQLAFDMKILEQLLEETRNEAMEMAQRKRELREEDQRYRQYLNQLKEEEAQRERELERLVDAEVEKAWERRLRQWRLEKEARRKLLEEVMESRRLQLKERMLENEKRQHESMAERETLQRRIAENRRIEQEDREKQHQKKMKYQSDILGQIDYNNRQNLLKTDDAHHLWQAQDFAEREYRTKLEIALANPVEQHAHPIRRRFTDTQLKVQGQGRGRMN